MENYTAKELIGMLSGAIETLDSARKLIEEQNAEIVKLKSDVAAYKESWEGLTNDLIKMHRQIYDNKVGTPNV